MPAQELALHIPIGPKESLEGNLHLPEKATGIVLFAHGSGSSRHSPRNRFVASVLNLGGIATLLMDLLTLNEEQLDQQTGHLRFDIALLTERLCLASDYVFSLQQTKQLPLGYFGASTGAAAALCAAAKMGKKIRAIVSRGGRPDLAGNSLAHVVSPTLLIVGGNDLAVIDMNKTALEQLCCEKKMEIVPHATHLFEEKGALERVADLALKWFLGHLQRQLPLH